MGFRTIYDVLAFISKIRSQTGEKPKEICLYDEDAAAIVAAELEPFGKSITTIGGVPVRLVGVRPDHE